jgi:rare lipoprotein A
MVFTAICKHNLDKVVSTWSECTVEVLSVVAKIKTSGQAILRRNLACQYLVLILLPLTMLCNGPQSSITFSKSEYAAAKSQLDSFNNTNSFYIERGYASWYGGNSDGFAGNMTANCEIYDPSNLTCAHRTLPFNTLVKVENIANGKNIVLRVNDRGPFIHDRILDISKKAAQELGLLHVGIAPIRLQIVNSKGHPMPVNSAIINGNPYTIQVAAFIDPFSAKQLSKELESRFNQKVYQVKQVSNGTTIARVRIGIYSNLEQAEKVCNALAKFCKERKLEPFITRQY